MTTTPREGLPELPAKVWRNTCTCHPETCCCAEYKVKLNGAFLIAGTREACETVVAAINAAALSQPAQVGGEVVGYFRRLTNDSGYQSGWEFIALGVEREPRIGRWNCEYRPLTFALPQPQPALLTNPHTGTPRDYRDVESDPAGVLIHKAGEPLLATTPPPPSDAAQGEARTVRVDELLDAVLIETLRMIDPFRHPQAGSYNRGHHEGIACAVKTIRDLWSRAKAGAYPFNGARNKESGRG